MKGQILDFSVEDKKGVITVADGTRYEFFDSEWKSAGQPYRGASVDFEIQERNAVAIYFALGARERRPMRGGAKDKVVAGVLAIVLGGFGAHKFYLGHVGPGLVFLLLNTIGVVLTVWMLLIPNFALLVIAVVEGIIYLSKSDSEFEQIYVIDRKAWF